ncbi:protein transport protein bet1 [Mucor circinelloides]
MSRQFGNRSSVRSYQNLHNRSSLFAGAQQHNDTRTPSPSAYGGDQQSVALDMNDRDLDYLESQNDDEISGLSAKVNILKNITGKIGEEIRSGNSFIDQMNDQFSNTGSVLGKTMDNFKVMASKESGTMWCCLTLFVVFIVFFFYYWFFK